MTGTSAEKQRLLQTARKLRTPRQNYRFVVINDMRNDMQVADEEIASVVV